MDFFGQVFADARQIGQFAIGIGGDFFQRLVQIVNRAGGVLIGAHAEGIGRLEFQDVGDELESGGDFGVVHVANPRAEPGAKFVTAMDTVFYARG